MKRITRRRYNQNYYTWFHQTRPANSQTPAFVYDLGKLDKRRYDLVNRSALDLLAKLDQVPDLEFVVESETNEGVDLCEITDDLGKLSADWSPFKVIDNSGKNVRAGRYAAREVYWHPEYSYDELRASYNKRGYSKSDADLYARRDCLEAYNRYRQIEDGSRSFVFVSVSVTYQNHHVSYFSDTCEITPDQNCGKAIRATANQIKIDNISWIVEALRAEVSTQQNQLDHLSALLDRSNV